MNNESSLVYSKKNSNPRESILEKKIKMAPNFGRSHWLI